MDCVVCTDDSGRARSCEHCPRVDTYQDPDFRVRDEGSLVLLWPVTAAARDWVNEHLPEDRLRWMSATVIEHRYVGDILAGIEADGLVLANAS
jgi:hypothetical protein